MRSALLLFLVACSGAHELPAPHGQPTGEPHRGGTLVMDLQQDLETLEPAQLASAGIEVGHLVYDSLVADDGGPMLAEHWSVSPDGLTWTFALREARFADGRPIAAADFVRAFERLRDPKVASPNGQLLDGVADVRAPDARHLEVRLEHPDTSFPLHLSMPSTAPLGGESGPFRVVEFAPGRRVVLERNRFYWGAPPHLDRIELAFGVGADAARLRFLRGDTQVLLDPAGPDYRRFLRSAAWRPYVVTSPGKDILGVAINTTRPPLGDRRVRQALDLAVNQHDLYLLSNGRWLPAHGPIPPGVPGHDPTQTPWRHDVTRARELLHEAGVDHLRLRYVTRGLDSDLRVAESLQADLADVGIALEIDPVSEAILPALHQNGDFDLIYYAWGGDFLDPSNFFQSFVSGAPGIINPARYRNPELDALLAQAGRETDPARRIELYRRAEIIVHDDCPWIWLGIKTNVAVHQANVGLPLQHSLWAWDLRQAWVAP